jgi:hypothetical protein
LLGCPRRSGMRGDRNMDDAATVMGQDHRTNSSRYVAVGTRKKSAAMI